MNKKEIGKGDLYYTRCLNEKESQLRHTINKRVVLMNGLDSSSGPRIWHITLCTASHPEGAGGAVSPISSFEASQLSNTGCMETGRAVYGPSAAHSMPSQASWLE
jgi:hypothetical protein